MDLGLTGRRALVMAASKGLGRACAFSLAREGVALTITARTAGPLEETAAAIRAETGVEVTAVAADMATDAGRAAALAACPNPDILVNNIGGPPPGNFRDWEREHWLAALESNLLSPIMMIKAVVDGMMERRFGRIVNITSAAVKAPIPTLGLGNTARTGLTGFVATVSRQVASHNVTINNLLPGPFETDRLYTTLAGEAKAKGITLEQAAEGRRNTNPAKRFGDPAEFGDACAYLCSAQAGFVTGQNLVMDGGAYPGTL